MDLNKPIEQLTTEVMGMQRTDCLDALRSLPSIFCDFTDEYLAALSLEQLRHIVMAACLQARKAEIRQQRGQP